ncbi:MAG: hypothetical protein D3903_07765 [Candidatus Electrothrix sp. GM3_4]|nr:hypothetical protein [Candidatus Electrothrix sp. GM3_4]
MRSLQKKRARKINKLYYVLFANILSKASIVPISFALQRTHLKAAARNRDKFHAGNLVGHDFM